MRDPHGHGSRSDDVPVLITAAEPSYADQYAARRRKYAILMSARIPCLILAGVFYQTWWLALSFVVLSIPLPWMAVLIANDRLPTKASKFRRFRNEPDAHELESAARQLEAKNHPIIES